MVDPELRDTAPTPDLVGALQPDDGSVLFLGGGQEIRGEDLEPPAYFHDLNLDQVVSAIVAGREAYDLRRFFESPLDDVRAVSFRQDVFRDLRDATLRAAVDRFAEEMRRSRAYLSLEERQHYSVEKQCWLVDAAVVYCDAVRALTDALTLSEPRSLGFDALRRFLSAYVSSQAFGELTEDAHHVREALNGVRYLVRIKGARVTVSEDAEEPEFTSEIERTFSRFRQGAVESHLFTLPASQSMSHVDARIAALVERLYPGPFAALEHFHARHRGFIDERVFRFDREVQFYLAYLDFAATIEADGLEFSYPSVAESPACVSAEGAFDIALAAGSRASGVEIVRNDFFLEDPERVLVVTGPNQGGKTTFARMFGQLHYLAALGVPVPARRARLALPDRIFAHFEREEDLATLRGKLDDELERMKLILDAATGASVVVINEIFSSTALADAVDLATEVLERIERLGCLAVVVTFMDELASHSEATVSMVAQVASDDPSRRTFRVVRRPADGRAYALALAEKYGLTYEQIRSRAAV